MNMKTVSVLVGVTISIIMVGFVLTPVINDAVDGTKVYYNNNYGSYAKVSNQEEVVIDATTTIGTAGSTIATVNGAAVDVIQGPRALAIADSFIIFQNYSNGIQVAGPIGENGAMYSKNHSSVNVVINGNAATFTLVQDGGTNITLNATFEWCYYRFIEGDYRLIDYISSSQSRTVNYNSLDQIHGSNSIGKTGQFFNFTGTDVTVYNMDGSSYDTTATVDITEVMNGVSSFVVDSDRTNSKAFHFTVDDNGSPYDVYPYYFVIPYEVYGQTESNIQASNILLVIPSMMLVVVIAMMVTLIRRD